MNSGIKFIYFDLGGVLFNWENYFTNVSKAFNFDKPQIGNLYNKYSEKIVKGTITPQEFWKLCQKELSIKNASEFDFLDIWVSDYQPVLEMHALAHALNKQYKIGIISNLYTGMYPLLIKKGKIPKLRLETVILSCEVGLQKPETEIYQLAEDKSGYINHEILYIDDFKENADAAKKMGWQTYLFDMHNVSNSINGIKYLLE